MEKYSDKSPSEKERLYFTDLVKMTQDFVNQFEEVDEVKYKNLEDFFNARKKIIDKIRNIENNAETNHKTKNEKDDSELTKTISGLDERVLEIFLRKKKKIIKDIKHVTDINNSRSLKRENTRKIVDLEG